MAEQAKLEDSNIANYGGSGHRDLRKDAAESEKAWEGAGQKKGTEIWRVESFGVKRWPKKQYGTFYQGDSYIILYTYKDAESDKLLHNLHFWIGRDSSQDEYGTAAYKTVELDDLLGDLPVQFREVQGHESKEFKALFKRMTILKGGVDSAFEHVKPEEYKPRLLHVKGKTEVVITQVTLRNKSLNDGDCFILDNGLELWQWNGSTSNHFERRKAMEMIREIQEQRHGKPSSKVIDGLEDDDKFWSLLGGKPSKLRAATPDENIVPYKCQLHRLSDESGKLRFKLEAEGEIKRSEFDPKDVFVVDMGHTIYVWIGSGASEQERAKAMEFGSKYMKDHDQDATTPVVRVVQGAEPSSFDRVFDGPPPEMLKKAHSDGASESKGGADDEDEDTNVYEGCVDITVHEGKELADVQVIGKQDPFCEVRLGKQKRRTEVHRDGQDKATWDAPFFLAIDKKAKQLILIVKNNNLIADKEIGRVSIPLSDLTTWRAPRSEWFDVCNKEGSYAGEIRATITFVPPVLLRFTEAKDLKSVQKLGKQDPYVRVKFRGRKQRTPTDENGAKNPKWSKDNAFEFNVAIYGHDEKENAAEDVLLIEVRNDNLISDDTIGTAQLSVKDLQDFAVGSDRWIDLDPKGQLHVINEQF